MFPFQRGTFFFYVGVFCSQFCSSPLTLETGLKNTTFQARDVPLYIPVTSLYGRIHGFKFMYLQGGEKCTEKSYDCFLRVRS